MNSGLREQRWKNSLGGLNDGKELPGKKDSPQSSPSTQRGKMAYIGSQKFCPFRRHVTKGNDGLGATAGQASSGTHK
jgi:hypothetical protein